MKHDYYKPQMVVVKIGGRQPLLNASPIPGMDMVIPGYTQGGSGTENSDGWSD